MHHLVVFLVVFVVACAVGYVVWLLTDSTSASYIVGVVGTALGAAALLVPERGRRLVSRIRARLDIRNLRGTDVENVRAPAGQDVDADMKVENAEGGVIRNVIVESADEPKRRGTP